VPLVYFTPCVERSGVGDYDSMVVVLLDAYSLPFLPLSFFPLFCVRERKD